MQRNEVINLRVIDSCKLNRCKKIKWKEIWPIPP